MKIDTCSFFFLKKKTAESLLLQKMGKKSNLSFKDFYY